jgi:PTH2 family peptidyl-tRNA hydrolase
MTETEGRMVILVNKNMSRGKQAAHAVHVALDHYGHTDHGAVIVLQESPTRIKEQALDGVFFQDQGRTEVEPGTVTACVKSFETVEVPEAYTGLSGEATYEIAVEKAMRAYVKAQEDAEAAYKALEQYPISERMDAWSRMRENK